MFMSRDTHPRSHASGREARDLVLEVDSSDSDHIHLVSRVVQRPAGSEQIQIILP